MLSNWYAQLEQLAPDRHKIGVIELKAGHCCPPCGGLSTDFASEVPGPLEVIFPAIRAWVKQRNKIAAQGIGSADVGPLTIVAVRAGVRQIVQVRWAASACRKDVVNFETAALKPIGKSTILTTPYGPVANGHTQVVRDSGHQSAAGYGKSPTSSGTTWCKCFRTLSAWSFCSVHRRQKSASSRCSSRSLREHLSLFSPSSCIRSSTSGSNRYSATLRSTPTASSRAEYRFGSSDRVLMESIHRSVERTKTVG